MTSVWLDHAYKLGSTSVTWSSLLEFPSSRKLLPGSFIRDGTRLACSSCARNLVRTRFVDAQFLGAFRRAAVTVIGGLWADDRAEALVIVSDLHRLAAARGQRVAGANPSTRT